MTESDIQAYLSSLDVNKEVRNALAKTGLPINTKSVDSEALNSKWAAIRKKYGSINEVPFALLGSMLDAWTDLLSYSMWAVAVSDIELRTTSELKSTVKNQLFFLAPSSSREMKTAWVCCHPIYTDLVHKELNAQAVYLSLKSLSDGYQYKVNAISREITRKGIERTQT
jgi:hypothetical protein